MELLFLFCMKFERSTETKLVQALNSTHSTSVQWLLMVCLQYSSNFFDKKTQWGRNAGKKVEMWVKRQMFYKACDELRMRVSWHLCLCHNTVEPLYIADIVYSACLVIVDRFSRNRPNSCQALIANHLCSGHLL